MMYDSMKRSLEATIYQDPDWNKRHNERHLAKLISAWKNPILSYASRQCQTWNDTGDYP